MDASPIEQMLSAVDRMDLDAAVSLLAADCKFLGTDGQRAEGTEEVKEMLSGLFSGLRSMSHKVLSEWREGDIWIAELAGTYELRNWLRLESLPRAAFVRRTELGITDARFYGAHEQSITEHDTDGEAFRMGGRWIPPL